MEVKIKMCATCTKSAKGETLGIMELCDKCFNKTLGAAKKKVKYE